MLFLYRMLPQRLGSFGLFWLLCWRPSCMQPTWVFHARSVQGGYCLPKTYRDPRDSFLMYILQCSWHLCEYSYHVDRLSLGRQITKTNCITQLSGPISRLALYNGSPLTCEQGITAQRIFANAFQASADDAGLICKSAARVVPFLDQLKMLARFSGCADVYMCIYIYIYILEHLSLVRKCWGCGKVFKWPCLRC